MSSRTHCCQGPRGFLGFPGVPGLPGSSGSPGPIGPGSTLYSQNLTAINQSIIIPTPSVIIGTSLFIPLIASSRIVFSGIVPIFWHNTSSQAANENFILWLNGSIDGPIVNFNKAVVASSQPVSVNDSMLFHYTYTTSAIQTYFLTITAGNSFGTIVSNVLSSNDTPLSWSATVYP